MELTFKDLTKKDVVNVVDGKNLGRITDIKLSFPKGVLVGIIVPGRKTNIVTSLFCKSQIYIDRSLIVKIGGDAILVKIDNCAGHNDIDKRPKPPINPCEPRLPCENFNDKKDDCECDAFDL